MPQNQVRGPIGRMFGTQDAIARLYSSPAGARKQGNQTANQNPPYNKNTSATSNQQNSHNTQRFMNDRGNVNSVNSIHPNSNESRSHPQYFANQNRINFAASPQKPDNLQRGQLQNGFMNNQNFNQSGNQSGYIMDASKMFYSQNNSTSPRKHTDHADHYPQNDSRGMVNTTFQNNQAGNHIDYRSSHTGQFSSPNPVSHPSHTGQYTSPNPAAHPSSQPPGPTRNTGVSAVMGSPFYQQPQGQAPGYPASPDNRLGLQPSWQYVGSGTPDTSGSRNQHQVTRWQINYD